MLVGSEFVRGTEQVPRRNGRLVTRAKDGSSATILVPTLFDMSKALMRMRCNLQKEDSADKVLEDFARLESAMMKMTIDIEYLRRKGY